MSRSGRSFSSTPTAHPVTETPQVSEETIRSMVRLQESKLAVELKQIELARQEIELQAKTAGSALEAQLKDRENQRQAELANKRNIKHLIAGLSVLFVVFALIAMYLEKEAVLLDLVKVGVGLASGFIAGRYSRKSKNPPEES